MCELLRTNSLGTEMTNAISNKCQVCKDDWYIITDYYQLQEPQKTEPYL